jgi:hypothetical protein
LPVKANVIDGVSSVEARLPGDGAVLKAGVGKRWASDTGGTYPALAAARVSRTVASTFGSASRSTVP